jgi:hypothetical protein
MTLVPQTFGDLTWSLPVPLPGLVGADGDSLVVSTPVSAAT